MAGTPDHARHLFVAPHLDDVALSCGGLVRRLTAAGEPVLIATVVTADPPAGAPLTRLARRHHVGWGLGDAPFGARCLEDLAAADVLGARSVHLGLLDAIYRIDPAGRPHYTRHILGVAPDPADATRFGTALLDALANALLGVASGAEVYSPLGIGGHVDHFLVRRAVEALVPPERIAYYEDYPYAGRRATLEPAGPGPWRSELIELTDSELAARIAATEAYTSQFPSLFPTRLSRVQEIFRNRLPGGGRLVPAPSPSRMRPHMERQLRAYVARVGGERYWRVSPAEAYELARATA